MEPVPHSAVEFVTQLAATILDYRPRNSRFISREVRLTHADTVLPDIVQSDENVMMIKLNEVMGKA